MTRWPNGRGRAECNPSVSTVASIFAICRWPSSNTASLRLTHSSWQHIVLEWRTIAQSVGRPTECLACGQTSQGASRSSASIGQSRYLNHVAHDVGSIGNIRRRCSLCGTSRTGCGMNDELRERAGEGSCQRDNFEAFGVHLAVIDGGHRA
jgi:hypothetical protein